MANFCEHCGVQLTRPKAPFCPNCRRPLRKNNSSPQGRGKAAYLAVQQSGGRRQPIPLTKPVLTMGRALTNDLVLNHPAVSRRHAQLELRGRDYWLVDLNSTNGIAINGTPVLSRALHDGDVIQIIDQQNNSIEITFHNGDRPDPPADPIGLDTSKLERLSSFTIGREAGNPLQLDHPAVSRRHAEIVRTPQGYQIRDLSSINGTFVNGRPVLGRQPLYINDVIQIGPFKLLYGPAGFSQYTPAGSYRLDAVGLTQVFHHPGPRVARGRDRHHFALKNIDLSIFPREFVALVGGSGAGKSVLMNALSGFVPAQSGRVYLNGDDLYTNFAAHRSVLGYVPQDDIIHQQLSVRSALTYAAQLRLPDASPAEIRQRINEVLREVDMVGHEAKQVKRLSGGQRKRVSIAVELLADPGVFFLDEPTSGLDPGLEKKMMHTMRRLADGGRTIVLSTHTTGSLSLCSHVAFMADGHLVFFGPPREAFSFFGVSTFPEIYDRLAKPVRRGSGRPASPNGEGKPPPSSAAEAWADGFHASPQYRQFVTDRLQSVKETTPTTAFEAQPLPRSVSGLRQFWILAQRYFDLISRDVASLFVLLAVMPIIGLLLWFTAERHDLVGQEPEIIEETIQAEITEQREAAERAGQNSNSIINDGQYQAAYLVVDQAQKLLFIMALAASLLGIFAAAYEIIKEQAIYRRERMINLKIMPYLFSKVGVLALFALLQCVLFLLVVRVRLSYPEQGVFLPAPVEIYITLFLATLANIGLGLFISSMVRSSGTVVYVILIVLFFQIIFAQAIFDLPGVVKPLSYLTTTRWTLEALGSSVDMAALGELESACIEFADWKRTALEVLEEPEFPCREGQVKQAIDFDFTVDYGRDPYRLLTRWLVLIEFALVFILLTYMAQKSKDLI